MREISNISIDKNGKNKTKNVKKRKQLTFKWFLHGLHHLQDLVVVASGVLRSVHGADGGDDLQSSSVNIFHYLHCELLFTDRFRLNFIFSKSL